MMKSMPGSTNAQVVILCVWNGELVKKPRDCQCRRQVLKFEAGAGFPLAAISHWSFQEPHSWTLRPFLRLPQQPPDIYLYDERIVA